jgi:hypothetical protein
MEERNRRKTEGGEPRREGERPERRPEEGLPPPPRPESASDAAPAS